MTESINYLGFIIDNQGLHPDPNQIKAIVDAPPPQDLAQLRSFLGMINYYAKFIPQLSTILHPLHSLLRKQSVKLAAHLVRPHCIARSAKRGRLQWLLRTLQ